MFWIVQSNLHREEGHARLVSALERYGSRFTEVQVLPFVDRLVPAGVALDGSPAEDLPLVDVPTARPVFCMGSYKLVRVVRGLPRRPGGFTARLDYTACADGWGHARMLNPHAEISLLRDAHPCGRESFVRPTSDSKEFAGRVFSRGAFYRWVQACAQEGSQHVPLDTEVLVAPPVRDIHCEVRTWVVDGRVVTWSLYRRGGQVFYSDQVDADALAFAQSCADSWGPNPAYVLDVALTDAGWRIVEANCLSAAGFYAGDMQKLVAAIEDFFT